MKFRDLEKVRSIVKDATGLEISYAYDDLVFPDHSAFIIRFDDNDAKKIYCHFHEDCFASDQAKIFGKLQSESGKKELTLHLKERFNLEQKGNEVQIKFLSN